MYGLDKTLKLLSDNGSIPAQAVFWLAAAFLPLQLLGIVETDGGYVVLNIVALYATIDTILHHGVYKSLADHIDRRGVKDEMIDIVAMGNYRGFQMGLWVPIAIGLYWGYDGFWELALFFLIHEFGFCDSLYYILNGQWDYPIDKKDGFFWLWWTPYGLWYKYVIKDTTKIPGYLLYPVAFASTVTFLYIYWMVIL